VRALITGGAGFVGHWLAEHLEAAGDEVVSVDMPTDVTDPDSIGPVLSEAAPEAIYHLAALTHVGESWLAPIEVLRVNMLGTATVLAAARTLASDPAVLVISSAEVYGLVEPEALPITEDRPVAPATPYAASKAAAEQVALQAWRGYDQRVIVVRPFNHIGPGQAPIFAVPAFAQRVVEARRSGAHAMPVGNLTARRDFTDVRDVVRAYRLLIERGREGTVYNVCTGTDVSIADVAARLLAISGVSLELVPDPSLVRPVDLPVLRGSPDRLWEATGWVPEIALDDTLRDVLAAMEAAVPT
jgi:GDP-4-dehydro-6-deoxy-D-mannose reductase